MSAVVVVKVFTVMNVRFKKFSPNKAIVVTLLLLCKIRYVRKFGSSAHKFVCPTAKKEKNGKVEQQMTKGFGKSWEMRLLAIFIMPDVEDEREENATPTQLFTGKAATQACDRDGRTHGQPAPSTAGTVVILGWESG
ncbi:hypothetical protein RUM44_006330 [Polyplax serrata]|uniref:Uncharacterized protein n=1 Tax=Polyplax serrata TaxID=468196 RepID=A0ABR1AIH9_POLSC